MRQHKLYTDKKESRVLRIRLTMTWWSLEANQLGLLRQSETQGLWPVQPLHGSEPTGHYKALLFQSSFASFLLLYTPPFSNRHLGSQAARHTAKMLGVWKKTMWVDGSWCGSNIWYPLYRQYQPTYLRSLMCAIGAVSEEVVIGKVAQWNTL